MSFFEETLPASYAGVSFLIKSSKISGGRKDALNQFPNSDKQTIEDLGKMPRSYDVRAMINQDSDGENYKQKRDDFLRVLEKGGIDILIHPFYGRLSNIVVRTYALTEEIRDLGYAEFSVSFAIDNGGDGVPVVSGDSLSQVQNSSEIAITAVNSDVAENFVVSNSFPANFTEAVNKVNEIIDEFAENTTFLQVAADQINEFSLQLSEVSKNVTTLVSTPQALADSITGLFQSVNGLYSSVDGTFAVIQRFFDFGISDQQTPIEKNTAGRIEREKNQNLLNNLVRSEALILNYNNASQITFSTVSEVEAIDEILEDQYKSVITGNLQNNDGTSPKTNSSSFSKKTLDSITDLRIQAKSFFEEQKLTSSRVVEVNTKTSPSAVIAYDYYASPELGQDIAQLNEDMNSSFISGDIGVFTQ